MRGGEQFTSAQDAARFMFGGNATFTLRSMKTGTRYTYRVRESEDGKLYFVSVLTGSDNEGDYTYVGITRMKDGAPAFSLTKASRMSDDSLPVRAFRYMLTNLVVGVMPHNVEVWHEGRCGRCGRTLTVPESISSGIGPECAKKLGAAA